MERTNKLLPCLISLPEVIYSKDECVDDTEDCSHVRCVICRLQLVHDHTEAVLLGLRRLKGELRSMKTGAVATEIDCDSTGFLNIPPLDGAIGTFIAQRGSAAIRLTTTRLCKNWC